MKVAIIGCGARGKDHSDAYARIPNVKLAACFDPDEERRSKLAKAFGMKAYAKVEDLLDKEEPDMVSIATYPAVRLQLMKLVSQREIPLCLLEKPLAAGVRDWREMVELEAVSKTKFAVSHQVRWHKDLRRCGEAVNSGRLGKVLFLHLSAGMNIAGQGTHTLNYGMFLNGDCPVKTVFGNAYGLDMADPQHPAPVASEALLAFENGVRALWTSGGVSPRAGSPDVNWQHVRVAACAEKGRVLYEEFGKWSIVEGGKSESGDYGGMDAWRANNCDSQTRLQKAMIDWLANPEKAPGTNLKQSLREWAVVLALYQSSVDGRPVEMKDFNPQDDLMEVYKKAKAN